VLRKINCAFLSLPDPFKSKTVIKKTGMPILNTAGISLIRNSLSEDYCSESRPKKQ